MEILKLTILRLSFSAKLPMVYESLEYVVLLRELKGILTSFRSNYYVRSNAMLFMWGDTMGKCLLQWTIFRLSPCVRINTSPMDMLFISTDALHLVWYSQAKAIQLVGLGILLSLYERCLSFLSICKPWRLRLFHSAIHALGVLEQGKGGWMEVLEAGGWRVVGGGWVPAKHWIPNPDLQSHYIYLICATSGGGSELSRHIGVDVVLPVHKENVSSCLTVVWKHPQWSAGCNTGMLAFLFQCNLKLCYLSDNKSWRQDRTICYLWIC